LRNPNSYRPENADHIAYQSTAFVVVTCTNVSVKNLSSGATFSLRATFSLPG
jgi:hypothetical protein